MSLAQDPGQWLRHLVLPALALGAVQAAVVMRHTIEPAGGTE